MPKSSKQEYLSVARSALAGGGAGLLVLAILIGIIIPRWDNLAGWQHVAAWVFYSLALVGAVALLAVMVLKLRRLGRAR